MPVPIAAPWADAATGIIKASSATPSEARARAEVSPFPLNLYGRVYQNKGVYVKAPHHAKHGAFCHQLPTSATTRSSVFLTEAWPTDYRCVSTRHRAEESLKVRRVRDHLRRITICQRCPRPGSTSLALIGVIVEDGAVKLSNRFSGCSVRIAST